MRLLHTADWHLGRTFHGASLIDHQAVFLEWLVELARREKVDGVLIAGDVYDRALPPADAVALAGDGLAELADGGRQVVVIPGNHDSAQRLAFGAPLLARAGLHVLTDPVACGTPVLIDDVAVYGIPYLEPELVGPALGCERRGHGEVMRAAMNLVRTDLAHRPPGTRSVLLAHAFVAGGVSAGSERELAVGGAAQVGGGLFSGIGYVALGHLHRPQSTAGGRYAGSPLALSFSEASDVKSVTLVELSPGGAAHTTAVPCPVPRALTRLRGTLEELLADRELVAHERDWVQATLTDPARPIDGMARLQRRFPYAVSLEFEPQGAHDAGEVSYAARLRGLSEEEVLARFVHDVRGTEAGAEELTLLLEALERGRTRQLERQRH